MNVSNFNAPELLMKSLESFLNSGRFVKMLHICRLSPASGVGLSPPLVTSQECVSQNPE